ncbi:MAG TPA: hypothetical protein VEF04_13615, partial [Blastocatellia bacterium]|nr:hypothetical protein [Blastocatellia bacterium]
ARTGLVQHVGFRGKAYLQPHDKDRMKRLLSRYMGTLEERDSRFIEVLDDAEYIFIRFEPETAVVRDQSYKVGGRTNENAASNNGMHSTPLHDVSHGS